MSPPKQSATSPPPAVSVVICVYNGASCLRETLDSVFHQTMPNLEVLAVDDGSTDGSRELLSSYSDPRLTVISQSNQGSAAALNAGLKAARGRYVAILDQDDLWLPGKLEAHCRILDREPDVDLTFSWYAVIDEDSRRIGLQSPRSRGRYGFADLLADYRIGPNCTVVVRAAAIRSAGPARPSLPRLYDFDLLLRIASLRPQNVAAVPAELTLYRRHRRQLSTDWQEMREEWLTVMGQFRRTAPEAVRDAAPRAEVNMNRYCAMVAYESGDNRGAVALLLQALKTRPSVFTRDQRNWRALAAALAGRTLPSFLHRWLERLAGLHRTV